MRWACVILASAGLLVVAGCRDYDNRLDNTLAEMKYQLKLEKNLEKASMKGALQSELIYIRPPKGLTGPTQTFSLVAVDPGKFDLENSFIDQAKSISLHVLARHKKPKPPPKKGAPPSETAPRGDFTAEVIEVVKAAYAADDLTPAKFKATSKKHGGRENSYREASLDLATKQVMIYIYGDKNSPYNVALIFEYPKSEAGTVTTRIGLTLEAFAVGDAAQRAFSGGAEPEGGGEGGGGEVGGPAVPA